MKIYDLSQDLNADCSFWLFYPPFEVKYIKRKSEHGVNAQYIQTSNHMGTHLDASWQISTGIDIRKVVELGITPRINTGIAHKNAGVGQVGAGLVRPPLKIFEDALLAYAEKYQL